MSKQPRAYQQYCIDWGLRRNPLISDQCGLGKTIEACGIGKALAAQFNKPVLVIAPNETVKLQWRAELNDQGFENVYWLESKDRDLDVFLTINPTGIVLTHYEAMVKHIAKLSAVYWSVVIADEAHRIKNRKAKRSIAIKQLRSYKRAALTGTPWDKNPADVWSILNWLEPEFFTSYWAFFNSHVNSELVVVKKERKDSQGRILEAAVTVQQVNSAQPLKNPANFARTLRPFMIQRTKQEVRADLPEKIEQYIDLEMSKKQLALYNTIKHAADPVVNLAPGVDTTVQIALTRILREIQVTTDPTLLNVSDVPSVKLEWLQGWLEDNSNESVLIFSRFRDTAIKIQKMLTSDTHPFKLIVGGKDKPAITTEDYYIVGTIAAMSEGFDLGHIDNCIFVDCEFSSILMTQALDRIHRITAKVAKNIYKLRCIYSVDSLVYNAIDHKFTTKQLVDAYLKGNNHENNPINQ